MMISKVKIPVYCREHHTWAEDPELCKSGKASRALGACMNSLTAVFDVDSM